MFRLLALGFTLLFFDQGTKFLAQSFISDEGFFLFFSNIELRVIFNSGFLNFFVPQGLIVVLSLFFITTFLWLYRQHTSWTSELGIILLLSGITGNMIDRIRFGAVIDWININGIGIINSADIFIVIGAVIYGWCILKKPLITNH